MGFYIRKSLRAGPFRFNFSKSGVGVSTGFTGFRIGSGPRGNYVHMGRNGLYYRATLPSGNKSNSSSKSTPVSQSPSHQASIVEMKDIESVDVLQLQDGSSADLLAEINEKNEKFRFKPLAILLSIIALFILGNLNVPLWAYALALPIEAIAIFLAHYRDQIVKTVILFYELESEAEKSFQALQDAFNDLRGCAQVWHIASTGRVTDLNEWKRQAGASSLVQRHRTLLPLNAPPFVSTNVAIPSVLAGKQCLYFFPDRILVYQGGKVGAVSYSDIRLQLNNTRFIESDAVPLDAQIVDHTWRFVNKNGTPDQRFNNNRQLPIALYGEIYFQSSTGLNELIQLSKPNMGSSLAEAFKKITLIQKEPSAPST